MRLSQLSLSCFAVAAALASCTNPTDPALDPDLGREGPSANAAGYRVYQVTINNLTHGQPLSPAAVVVHSEGVSLFKVGGAASEGIRQIAENGDPSYLVTQMTGRDGVADAQATTAPVHRIGGPGATSLTFQVMARGQANRLSLATMLICTNDGFTGLDGVRLPGGFRPVSYRTNAYDGGTEANSELDGDIVPPCFGIGPTTGTGGGGRTATNEPIAMHPGIVGGEALTSAHQWQEKVTSVTIVRIR
ncbi:MAG: spondin domain-containing protein [Gemmatimonadales bacterium]